jgi:hypothetical protein
MLETSEGLLDVVWRGKVYSTGIIVSEKAETAILRAGPVGGDGVKKNLEGGNKMFSIFATNIFHAKIINNEGELVYR